MKVFGIINMESQTWTLKSNPFMIEVFFVLER